MSSLGEIKSHQSSEGDPKRTGDVGHRPSFPEMGSRDFVRVGTRERAYSDGNLPRSAQPDRPVRTPGEPSDAPRAVLEQEQPKPPDMLRASNHPEEVPPSTEDRRPESARVLDRPPSNDIRSLDIVFNKKTYGFKDLASFAKDYGDKYAKENGNEEKIGPINFAGESFKDFEGFKKVWQATIDRMIPEGISAQARKILNGKGLSNEEKGIKSRFEEAKKDKGVLGKLLNTAKENMGVGVFLYLGVVGNAAKSVGNAIVAAEEAALHAQGGGEEGSGMPFFPGMGGKGEQDKAKAGEKPPEEGKAGEKPPEEGKAGEKPPEEGKAGIDNAKKPEVPETGKIPTRDTPPLDEVVPSLTREIGGDLDRESDSGDAPVTGNTSSDSESVFSKGSSRRSSMSSVNSDSGASSVHEEVEHGALRTLRTSLSTESVRGKATDQEPRMRGALPGKA